MRILFDQGTPVPLRLGVHEVSTAFELGWSELKNGELLHAAQSAGYEILVTTDKNLRYQQNLAGRSIAVAVLSTPSWPRIKRVVSHVVEKLTTAPKAGYIRLTFPRIVVRGPDTGVVLVLSAAVLVPVLTEY